MPLLVKSGWGEIWMEPRRSVDYNRKNKNGGEGERGEGKRGEPGE